MRKQLFQRGPPSATPATLAPFLWTEHPSAAFAAQEPMQASSTPAAAPTAQQEPIADGDHPSVLLVQKASFLVIFALVHCMTKSMCLIEDEMSRYLLGHCACFFHRQLYFLPRWKIQESSRRQLFTKLFPLPSRNLVGNYAKRQCGRLHSMRPRNILHHHWRIRQRYMHAMCCWKVCTDARSLQRKFLLCMPHWNLLGGGGCNFPGNLPALAECPDIVYFLLISCEQAHEGECAADIEASKALLSLSGK